MLENLKAKDEMDMTIFIKAAEFSYYHGSDLALRVLSRILKIPIAAWNFHFIWVSAPYISVYECPVIVVMDCMGNFHPTGDHDNCLMLKIKIALSGAEVV